MKNVITLILTLFILLGCNRMPDIQKDAERAAKKATKLSRKERKLQKWIDKNPIYQKDDTISLTSASDKGAIELLPDKEKYIANLERESATLYQNFKEKEAECKEVTDSLFERLKQYEIDCILKTQETTVKSYLNTDKGQVRVTTDYRIDGHLIEYETKIDSGVIVTPKLIQPKDLQAECKKCYANGYTDAGSKYLKDLEKKTLQLKRCRKFLWIFVLLFAGMVAWKLWPLIRRLAGSPI